MRRRRHVMEVAAALLVMAALVQAQAVCPETCGFDYRPVCGSDGVTYTNDCTLSQASCTDVTLSLVSTGPCDTPGALATGQTPDPAPAPSSACDQKCTRIFAPVCGTDGSTYNNMCLLQVADCQNRETGGSGIDLGFEAACDTGTALQDTPAPAPGAVPDSAPAPTSACDQQCTRIFAPVCGTNGQTYPNVCVLRAEDCLDKEAGGNGVGLAFEAACDAQTPAPTPAPTPPPTPAPTPASSCDEKCTRIFAPVCGTDGRTYNNMCLLQVADCKNREAGGSGIGLAFETACDAAPPSPTETNLVDVCRRNCPKTQEPVCGTNGRTYDNDCQLDEASCMAKEAGGRNIYVLHKGECDAEFRTRAESGGVGGRCRVSCPYEYRPVCGSDGTTYTNECVMDIYNCGIWSAGGRGVYIVKDGECGGRREGTRSSSSSNKSSRPSTDAPLISSLGGEVSARTRNSASASSQPALTSSSSQSSPSFSKPSDGPSQPSSHSSSSQSSNLSPPKAPLIPEAAPELPCPEACTKEFRPVCGSDGLTYSNLCSLQAASCRLRSSGGPELYKNFEGPCVAALPQGPACDRQCTKIFKPVCGSDGETYNNPCLLRLANCLNPFAEITLAADTPCDPDKGIGGFGDGQIPTDRVDVPDSAPVPGSVPVPSSPQVPGSIRVPGSVTDNGTAPVPGSVPDHGTIRVPGSVINHSIAPVPGTVPVPGSAPTACDEGCPKIRQPVCGTNGRTYDNQCILLAEDCKNKEAGGSGIGLAFAGPCELSQVPQDTVTDAPVPAPASTCDLKCTRVVFPVCGTDGITYDNECVLQVADCQSREAGGSSINIAYEGPCDQATPPPTPASSCNEHCTRIFTQVCGSDGRTYNNECLLQVADCRSREAGGEGVTLLFEDACDASSQSPPVAPPATSVCDRTCTKIYHPVCGTDGRTYSNECELTVIDCLNKEAGGTGIGLAYYQACELVVADSDEVDSSSVEDFDDNNGPQLVVVGSYIPPF